MIASDGEACGSQFKLGIVTKHRTLSKESADTFEHNH